MKYKDLALYLSRNKTHASNSDEGLAELLQNYSKASKNNKFLGRQFLKQAVLQNDLLVLKFLIDKCRVDIKGKIDAYGNGILFFTSDPVTTQILISCGADIGSKGALARLPLHSAANASLAKLYLRKEYLNATDISGNTPMHIAAREGRVDVVEFLISQGADCDILNRSGQNSLHVCNNEKIASILVKNGVKIDAVDYKGRTALHLSSNDGLTKFLLQQGAAIELRDNEGQTALHHALSSYSKKDIAKTLIRNNADIYSKDNYGKTPAHKVRSLEIGKLLFRLFPEFKKTLDEEDADGKTPLQYAITEGKKSLALLFAHSGADINRTGDNGKSLLHLAYNKESVELLIDKGIRIDTRDAAGKTPLYDALLGGSHYVAKTLFELGGTISDDEKNELLSNAATCGHRAVAEMLCKLGANKNQVDAEGKNLAYIALRNQHLSVTEFFLNEHLVITKAEQDSFLIAAIADASVDIVEFLLARDVDINQLDADGHSLMYLAAKEQNIVIAKLLGEQGLKLNDKDYTDLVRQSIDKSNVKLIDFLIEQFALDINTKLATENTPLQYAIEQGKKFVVEHLIACKASTDELDMDKLLINAIAKNHIKIAKWLMTFPVNLDIALLYSVQSGCAWATEMLAKAGADLSQTNADNKTLLDLAYNVETIKIILQYRPQLKDNMSENDQDILRSSIREGKYDVAKLFVDQSVELPQSEKDSFLNNAIKNNHHKIVNLMISYGAHVNQKDKNPLHAAARYNNIEAVKSLLDKGVITDQVDSNGKMALEVASNNEFKNYLAYQIICKVISNKNANCIKILQQMPDINYRDADGKTLLMHAVNCCNEQLAKQILTRNPDINLKDYADRNALYYSFHSSDFYSYGKVAISQLLISRGARIEAYEAQETLKYLAGRAYQNPVAAANILCKFGADPLAANILFTSSSYKFGTTAMAKWVLGKGENVNKLVNGNCALNNTIIGKLLIDYGIRPPAHQLPGLLSSYVRSSQCKDEEKKYVITKLIQWGGDITKTDILHVATSLEMVKWLISRGADIHYDSAGNNALYTNLSKGRIEIAEYLYSLRLRIDDYSASDLFVKCINNHNYEKTFNFFVNKLHVNLKGVFLLNSNLCCSYPQIIKWLLDHGADISAVDEYSRNAVYYSSSNEQSYKIIDAVNFQFSKYDYQQALAYAVQSQNKYIIASLIAHGADINKTMAVHQAKTLEMLQWFVGQGADISKLNDIGKNALFVHCSSNNYANVLQPMIKYLFDQGLRLRLDEQKELFENYFYGYNIDKLEMLSKFFNYDFDSNINIWQRVRYAQMVKYFVSKDIDVNLVDQDGHTALYHVAHNMYSQPSMLRYMMNRGAKMQESEIVTISNSYYGNNINILNVLIELGLDINKNLVLFKATDIHTVKFLISKGADINIKDTNGKSLLYKAFMSMDEVRSKFFLQQGLQFDLTNKDTLIEVAVVSKNISMLKLLLSYVGQIGDIEFTTIPNLQMAKFLVAQGLNLQKNTKLIESAIWVPVCERAKLVKYYLSCGAKLPLEKLDDMLLRQIVYGNEEMIELLISHGANIKEIPVLHSATNLQFIKWLIAKGADINLLNSTGSTGKNVLYNATKLSTCSIEVIKFYLSKGLKYEQQDLNGLLENVVSFNKKELIDLLISYGADITKACILHKTQSVSMMKWLIDKGADINLEDTNGKTALYQAVAGKKYAIVDFLFKDKPIIEFGEISELLHKAVENSDIRMLRVFEKNDVNIISDSSLIFKVKNVTIAQFLIHQGLDINSRDSNGSTALHFAVKNNNFQLVKFLVEVMNIDTLLVKNAEDKTAMHYAGDINNKNITAEILSGLNLGAHYNNGNIDDIDHEVSVLLGGDLNDDMGL